ncbi:MULTISPECIES: recombinase family protein [Kordiimonas]|jgi:site-specific DNA recombinase|uniref:recombinase family protein n=1 Tax=Kordiimonas TaxID=288021 RepID=UPI00258110CC|nr:recombinase family protein [Kordiimonas sp. UBA4487]
MASTRTGPTPFGYRRESSRLVLDPDEASIRLRAFELFVEHERRQTVCDILNAEGHRTRNDALFTLATLTRLLKDDIVLGGDEVEALIPEDLWNRCQAILETQQGKGGPPARKVANLFSGFLHCGCGQKMYVPTNSAKYVCGECLTKIAKNDLEDIFHAQLKEYPLPSDLKSDGQALSEKWDSFSFENKRKLVETITQRIEVADKKVTCFLFIL